MEHKNVLWKNEEMILTLDGLTMMEWNIALPKLEELGRGGRRIEKYYVRLAEQLKRRWGGKCYVLACLDYGRCQAEGCEFIPWQGSLTAGDWQMEEQVLTITMHYEEHRGSRGEETTLIDRWAMPWGCPILEKKGKKIGAKK